MTRIIVYISAALLSLLLLLPFVIRKPTVSQPVKEVKIQKKQVPRVKIESPETVRKQTIVSDGKLQFVRDYTCRAGRFDDESTCKVIAYEQVKRDIMKELADHLVQNEEAKQAHVTEEEALSIVPALGSVTILQSTWIKPTYYIKSSLTLKATGIVLSGYFPRNCRYGIVKCIESFRDNPENMKQMKKVRETAASLLDEIRRIRDRVGQIKGAVSQDNYEYYLRLINELSALDWFEKGRMAGVSEYRKAVNAFSKAIALNPGYADAYCNRGEAYVRLGNRESALNDFTEAIKLDPNNEYYYFKRGETQYYLKHYQQSIDDFSMVLEFNPGNSSAYNSRGTVHKMLGNYQQAIDDYNVALEIDPGKGSVYLNRGDCFNVIGRYAQAARDFSKIIDENLLPSSLTSLVLLNRGKAYFNMGYHQQALHDLSKSIELNRRNYEGYYYRGMVYEDAGSYESALSDFSRAIELNPKFARGYYYRAWVYSELNNDRKSIEDYKSAARLGLKEARSYLNKKGIMW